MEVVVVVVGMLTCRMVLVVVAARGKTVFCAVVLVAGNLA